MIGIFFGCHPNHNQEENKGVVYQKSVDSLSYFFSKFNDDLVLDSTRKIVILDSCLYYVNEIIDNDPTNKSFYNFKIRLLASKKDYKNLIATINNTMRLFLSENNQVLLFYKGICFEELGDFNFAKEQFHSADSILNLKLRLYPDSADLMIQSVYFIYHQYGIKEAEKQYNFFLRSNSSNSTLKAYKYNMENFHNETQPYFGP